MVCRRRSSLQAGGVISLAAVLLALLTSIGFGQQHESLQLGSGLDNPVPREALRDPLYSITRAMFTDNLKSRFSFSREGVKLGDLILVAVDDLNPPFVRGNGTSPRECFSLVFGGTTDVRLDQGTYTVEHAKLGKFKLFIVPYDAGASLDFYCEALINRVYP